MMGGGGQSCPQAPVVESSKTQWTMHGLVSNIWTINSECFDNYVELEFIFILAGVDNTSWWWNQSQWSLVCHNELTSYGPAPWAFSTPQSRGNTHPAVGQDRECWGRSLYCRDFYISPGHHQSETTGKLDHSVYSILQATNTVRGKCSYQSKDFI